MIYEMRTYTVRPGSQATVAENAGTVARSIRGDEYGKLEGYWLTELGPLSQVVHLWSYDGLDERQRLRARLAENQAWTSEYLPLIRPNLVRQEVRLMQAVTPLKRPETEGNVYEYRSYRAQPGRVREWARLFVEAMPIREKYSKNVCTWVTEAGQPNEVSHLWAYPSLDTRAQIRAELARDPDWRSFLERASPLLEETHSTVMLPAAHSPLK